MISLRRADPDRRIEKEVDKKDFSPYLFPGKEASA
jgi:hypothetical protein